VKLFYLTSAPFALSNLALRRLKIARFADLNDPFELLPVNLADAINRRALCAFKESINETIGLICFSSTWDNPVLWGHYGDKHAGIALGFEVPDALANKVLYSDRPFRIPFDPKTKRAIPNKKTVNRLLRTKFVDWKYEKEYRLFVQLEHSTRESGMYFYDFSEEACLCEVILGPKCELPADRIDTLLKGFKQPIRLIKSRIAFESFRVVENKNFGHA
jgi:hypothetical protein